MTSSPSNMPFGRSSRRKGLTLIEIMTTTAILMGMTLMLGWLITTSVSFYRMTLTSSRVSDEAADFFLTMGQDLRQVFTYTPYASRRTSAIFLLDFDSVTGRQRIRFTKSIPREEWNPQFHMAGSKIAAEKVYDASSLDQHPDGSDLKALGGVSEVAYFFDPEETSPLLRRGERSPILAPGSFFERHELAGDMGTPVSNRVLYFAVLCWHNFTQTWSPDEWNRKSSVPVWNSTTPYFTMRDGHPDVFGTREQWVSWAYKFPYGLDILTGKSNPWDDVFPKKVKLVALIRSVPREGVTVRLTRDIDEASGAIPVEAPFGFRKCDYIVIGNEVMKTQKEGDGLTMTDNAHVFVLRDQSKLLSRQAAHARGTPVFGGERFDYIVAIPSSRVSFTRKSTND